MAQVRVKISSSDLSLSEQVVPVAWDTVLRWEREKDSANYTQNPKSDIVIRCVDLPAGWSGGGEAAFDALIAAESDCNTFDLSVEVYCSGAWSEVWAGQFSSQDWNSDQDKKIIRIRPDEVNPFDCLKQNWKNIENPFGVTPVIEVKPYTYIYEHTEYTDFNVLLDEPCDAPPPESDYCYYDFDRVTDQVNEKAVCIYMYHRLRLPGTCDGSTPVEPDAWQTWTLLDDNCPTSSDWWVCPEDARVPFTFPNGRMLEDVLDYLFTQTGCSLTIKSDFFNINADASAPSNVAYTAAALYCQKLVVFQKSDVKRHDASDQSTEKAWDMKLSDVLNDLKLLFNLDWQIQDSGATFRIEHVSYFEASVGNDYTNSNYKRILEQEPGDVPRLRRFFYRDEVCSDYFTGSPIEIYCGDDEVEERLSLFSCDISFIINDNQAENVGDEGFVLMATVEDTGVLYNVDDNRGLSWTELHENFYRHNMPGAGEINGSPVTPLSLRPVKKQPSFKVKHCCDDSFEVGELQTTALGDGQVQTAEINLTKEILELELKY